MLLEAGLAVTINSDYLAYFGGYIGENDRRIAAAQGLTKAFLPRRLAANAIEGSFAAAERKRETTGGAGDRDRGDRIGEWYGCVTRRRVASGIEKEPHGCRTPSYGAVEARRGVGLGAAA